MNDLNEIAEKLISNEKCNCLTVLKGGEILFEGYGESIDSETVQPINSITKTVVSILVGIALDKGYIESLEDDISAYVPGAQKVSIKEHLVMASGMDWDEGLIEELSWKNYICSKAIVEDRIGSFAYNGGSSHLLGIAISRATGMSLEDFARKYLFGPLEIELLETAPYLEYKLSSYSWERRLGWDRDPEGYSIGSFGLSLKARDLLKLGRLLLDKGVYGGKRIVSSEYTEEMLSPRVKAGLLHYGYQIWIKKTRGVSTVSALGYGNQYITVLPEHEAVIVMLSENDGKQSDEIEKLHGQLVKAVSEIV